VIDTEEPCPDTPIPEKTELFFVSLGKLPRKIIISVIVNLVDRSLIYMIISKDSKSISTTENSPFTLNPGTNFNSPETPEPDTTFYIMTIRYNSSTFYKVVIDTRASQKSIAGYEQYLAYEKTYPDKINTSRARMKVQFGIGTTFSIRSVII
jgi:hypothetical protein